MREEQEGGDKLFVSYEPRKQQIFSELVYNAMTKKNTKTILHGVPIIHEQMHTCSLNCSSFSS
jgi:hypothetical protein